MNSARTHRASWTIVVPTLVVLCCAQLLGQQVPTRTSFAPRTVPRKDNHLNLVHADRPKRPTVALVLSGGGARGLSSIGVLKALEAADISIDLIVGTSIGSIVGGLYASGYTADQLERLARTTNWSEVLSYDDDARRTDMFLDQKLATDRSILVLRFDGFTPVIPASYSTGQRLTNFLNILVLQAIYRPDPGFDALRIPFRAVTTDLISGKQFIFDRGDLSEALRASVSVPLLFSAVPKDSMLLLDGGLISNMPVDVARAEGMECVVVVDVTSPLRPAEKLTAPWEQAEQIIGIMMQPANERSIRTADVLIRPDLGGHLSSDFSSVGDLIASGEEAGREAVARIRSRISEGRVIPGEWRRWPPDLVVQGNIFGAEASTIIASFRARTLIGPEDVQLLVDDLFATGEFRHVSLDADVTSDSSARLTLSLGAYPVLRNVEIRGNTVFPTDTLRSYFDPLLGRPLNAERSQKAIDGLIGRYRTAGLSLAHLDSVTFDSITGTANLLLDEGLIARMTIRGTSKTKDYVIWRELPFGPGDLFEVSKVSQGLSNIYSTNLFEQASVIVEREGESGERNVVVLNIRERHTDLIRLGMRIDNERGMQPWIDVRDENVFGAGAEFGVSFYGGYRNQFTAAELKAVRIFDSYLTGRIQGYVSSKDVNTFVDVPGLREDRFDRVRNGEIREVKRGGLISFGSQLERLGDVSVEGRLERHQVYNIFGQPITNEDYNISSIRFGTRVDTQNKFPYPTAGTNVQFQYESALVKALDAVGFTKLFFSYESYLTYAESHTFHPRIAVGIGDDAVPTSEQFTLGGQDSFFGFREDNERGRQLLQGSLEYLYQLPISFAFKTYLKARYDFGSVWLRSEEIRLIDFQHAVGLGLGFDTPVGPVEVAAGRSFYIRKELLDKPLALGPLLFTFSLGYRFR